MSSRTARRLCALLCVALVASLIVQLVGDYDLKGLPFLYFAIAVTVLGLVAILSNLKRKPVEKSE
jgi:hypothetical protein